MVDVESWCGSGYGARADDAGSSEVVGTLVERMVDAVGLVGSLELGEVVAESNGEAACEILVCGVVEARETVVMILSVAVTVLSVDEVSETVLVNDSWTAVLGKFDVLSVGEGKSADLVRLVCKKGNM